VRSRVALALVFLGAACGVKAPPRPPDPRPPAAAPSAPGAPTPTSTPAGSAERNP